MSALAGGTGLGGGCMGGRSLEGFALGKGAGLIPWAFLVSGFFLSVSLLIPWAFVSLRPRNCVYTAIIYVYLPGYLIP